MERRPHLLRFLQVQGKRVAGEQIACLDGEVLLQHDVLPVGDLLAPGLRDKGMQAIGAEAIVHGARVLEALEQGRVAGVGHGAPVAGDAQRQRANPDAQRLGRGGELDRFQARHRIALISRQVEQDRFGEESFRALRIGAAQHLRARQMRGHPRQRRSHIVEHPGSFAKREHTEQQRRLFVGARRPHVGGELSGDSGILCEQHRSARAGQRREHGGVQRRDAGPWRTCAGSKESRRERRIVDRLPDPTRNRDLERRGVAGVPDRERRRLSGRIDQRRQRVERRRDHVGRPRLPRARVLGHPRDRADDIGNDPLLFGAVR